MDNSTVFGCDHVLRSCFATKQKNSCDFLHTFLLDTYYGGLILSSTPFLDLLNRWLVTRVQRVPIFMGYTASILKPCSHNNFMWHADTQRKEYMLCGEEKFIKHTHTRLLHVHCEHHASLHDLHMFSCGLYVALVHLSGRTV